MMLISEEYFYHCPYCATENSLLIDFTGGTFQEFVTDCEICCRPITIRFHLKDDEINSFEAMME